MGERQAREVTFETFECLGLGGGEIGTAQSVSDADEFAVVAVQIVAAQRPRVIDLVGGGNTPDDGGVVPAQPVRIVGVIGKSVGPNTFDGVMHGPHRAGQTLGGVGGAISGADEEGQRMAQADIGPRRVDPPHRLDPARTIHRRLGHQARMMHAHPEDARVQTFHVRRALQPEDECGRVGMHVPGRRVRAEPARIADRVVEAHPAQNLDFTCSSNLSLSHLPMY